ncbi:MAG: carbohydrate-binding domain-containing protein [Bacteroidales bacterium]|nr:carbohydrate-binding domain-containing protein [Bacteroidales bacterium]
MKKIFLALTLSLIMSFGLSAQNAMWIYNSDGTITTYKVAEIDSLNFTANMLEMLMFQNGVSDNLSVKNIDSIVFRPIQDIESSVIYVEFYENTATVLHGIYSEDFVVTVEDANVSIVSNAGIENLQYYLSGQTSDGSFSLESDSDFELILNGVDITSSSKVPLNLAKKVDREIIVANGTTNVLTDNTDSDGKSALNTKGATNISGNGSLTVNANKKHGISSDYDITIDGPTLTINHNAEASKGLKSDSNIIFVDGDITIVSSGTLTMEPLDNGYDPTYCTAIGADGNFEMLGGNLSITLPVSNDAGRGIKVDGNITISDGVINIISHSNGDTYTNSEGNVDSYKSCCIKADGDISILKGDITLEATGSGGKCIDAEGAIYIGNENGETELVMDMKTTGEKFYESGYGENAEYANPKILKAQGDLYVYGGNINVYAENDGGEGLESKSVVYILGGYIIIDTYDDAINGKVSVQIDGGTVYANSRGNDAIDSNGTMTINGGLLVAIGQMTPEGAFDCDQNTFKITGGTVIGVGGHHSTPTSSVCTQRALVYNGITNGTAVRIVNENGDDLMTFQMPTYSGNGGGGGPGGGGWPGGGGPGGGSSISLLFSSANLQQGTITVKQGGTISGGDEFYGYFTGAEYTGGTTSQNVTINGMVTTYGGGGGPF